MPKSYGHAIKPQTWSFDWDEDWKAWRNAYTDPTWVRRLGTNIQAPIDWHCCLLSTNWWAGKGLCKASQSRLLAYTFCFLLPRVPTTRVPTVPHKQHLLLHIIMTHAHSIIVLDMITNRCLVSCDCNRHRWEDCKMTWPLAQVLSDLMLTTCWDAATKLFYTDLKGACCILNPYISPASGTVSGKAG